MKTITGQTKHVSFTDTTANTNVTGSYDFDITNNNLVTINANYSAKEKGKENTYLGSASLTKQLDNRLSKNYTLPTDTTIAAELQQHFEALITDLQAEATGTTTSSTTVENQEA